MFENSPERISSDKVRKTTSRREFLGDILRGITSYSAISVLDQNSVLPKDMRIIPEPNFRDNENQNNEQNPENNLRDRLELLIQNKNAGFSLRRLNPTTGEEIILGINQEKKFPTASSFKAMVLLAYLTFVPVEEWDIDKGSKAYNMIVYSHNLATGDLLYNAFANHPNVINGESNPIIEFNNFLRDKFGIENGMISEWGFGSKVEGMIDTRFSNQTVNIGESDVPVSNLTTTDDLCKIYSQLSRIVDSENQQKANDLFYLLSTIVDPRYFSPLERTSPHFFGKDGYLTDSDLPGTGPTKIDAGNFLLSNGEILSVSLATTNVSETLANQISDEIKVYFTELATTGIYPITKNISENAMDIFREKMGYFFTNEEHIDGEGFLNLSESDLAFLETTAHQLKDKELGKVILVNLFDGTISVYDHQQGTNTFIAKGLVGKRLPHSIAESAQINDYMAQTDFSSNGLYKSKGVYSHKRAKSSVDQHTVTPPLLATYAGSYQQRVLESTPVNNPVNMLAIKVLNEVSGKIAETNYNSEHTIQDLPQVDQTNPLAETISERRIFLEQQPHLDRISCNPYWTNGAVNVRTEVFHELTRVMQESSDKANFFIMSYKGTDLQSLIFSEGFESIYHPMHQRNFTNATNTTLQ